MARTSQTELAVLGALSTGPMTGYAVREAIRDVLGHFWSESFGQIYPTLAALEQAGHVRRDEADRTLHITASGTARLRELLATPAQPNPPRNGLLLRVFFGRTLGVEACRELIAQARAQAEQRLAEYELMAAQVAEESQPDAPFMLCTINAGRKTAGATIAWADESLAALAELA